VSAFPLVASRIRPHSLSCASIKPLLAACEALLYFLPWLMLVLARYVVLVAPRVKQASTVLLHDAAELLADKPLDDASWFRLVSLACLV
jgi:hypothetical protein